MIKTTESIYSARALSIIKAKALDMVNQLETTPFVLTDPNLQAFLDSQRFGDIRQVIGENISIKGKYALGIVPKANNGLALIPLEIIKAELDGNTVVELSGLSGATFYKNEMDYQVYTHYYFNKGVATLDRYIYLNVDEDFKKYNITKPVKFKYKFLPVQVFKNNYQSVCDSVECGVSDQLIRLSEVDKKYVEIYNITQSQLIVDTNFTSSQPKTLYKEIASGRGFITYNSLNDRLGTSQSITQPTIGSQMYQQHVMFEEMDIMTKLGLRLDSQQSGTNKHYFEVAMQSEGQLNYSLRKIPTREKEWNELMQKICIMKKFKYEKFTLELGFIANIKLERLKAEAVPNPAIAKVESVANNE